MAAAAVSGSGRRRWWKWGVGEEVGGQRVKERGRGCDD